MRRGFPAVASAVVCSLLALSFTYRLATAQDVASEALSAGKWAFLFEVEDDFQLGSFDGAAFSLKHQTSDRAAWRYGLSLNGRFGFDTDAFQEITVDTLTPSSISDHSDSGTQGIAIDVTRLMYPGVDGRIRPFWGLGPELSYLHNSDDRTNTDSAGNLQEAERTITRWSAGVGVKLGVEVFAARRISVLGEYGTSFVYSHDKDEVDLTSTPSGGFVSTSHVETTNQGFQVGNQAVRLGVSAYF